MALMASDKSDQMARRASIIDGVPFIKQSINPDIKHVNGMSNGIIPTDDKRQMKPHEAGIE